MASNLYVSSSPHLRSNETTKRIMLDVVIALIPAVIASIIFFGLNALMLIAITVASCVLFEYVSRKVMKRNNTISDLSAVVTGVLLALNLPPTLNPMFAVFGSLVAIVVIKQMFGGIGQNFVNPAIGARIVLLVSFPVAMTTWVAPFFYTQNIDAVSSATPLALNAQGEGVSYIDLFIGNTAGSMGETSALALLVGGIYLVLRKVIKPTIPLCFIGSVFIMSYLLGQDGLFHILSGGVMLSAIFMATDYTTSPMTSWGKVIFGVSCGIITVLIRLYASLPEGVSYSIIIMNIFVAQIENITLPKRPKNKMAKG